VTHVSCFAAFANVVVLPIVSAALRLLDRNEFRPQNTIGQLQVISISKMLEIELFSHRSLAQ
jgi:hypothetical protein